MEIRYNLAAIVCSHVFEETRPILLVCKEDEEWQFLCGDTHEDEVPQVVCIGHLLDRDPTLREILDLPDGWEAERQNVEAVWERRDMLDAEDEEE